MARQTGAGDLRHRVRFAEPQAGSDGAGGALDGFMDRFDRRAEYTHLRGGETVLAARLEGRHPQIIRVRADSETREVTTDWRITDARTGTVYAIRDVTWSEDRAWIDFLAESGVAT